MIAALIFFFFLKTKFSMTANGIIEPQDQILVKSPIDGIIEDIYVEEGGKVLKGEKMFRICGIDLEKNNEIILEEYRIKKFVYENSKELYESGIISGRDFMEAQKEYKISKINKDKISKTIVMAPSDGFVVNDSELRLKKDDYVQKGELLTKISNLDKYIVRLSVDEKDIYRVKLGDEARIQIRGFSNYKSIYKGYVMKVLPEGKVRNNNSIFEVVVLLTDSIDPGEYVKHMNIFPMMGARVKIVYGNMTFFKYLLQEKIGNETD